MYLTCFAFYTCFHRYMKHERTNSAVNGTSRSIPTSPSGLPVREIRFLYMQDKPGVTCTPGTDRQGRCAPDAVRCKCALAGLVSVTGTISARSGLALVLVCSNSPTGVLREMPASKGKLLE
jgi:hypothetical protein